MESLPHLKQPRVRINAESVFENLAYEAKAGHPIEEVQRKMPQTEFQAKVAHRARVFGPAAAGSRPRSEATTRFGRRIGQPRSRSTRRQSRWFREWVVGE